MKILVATDGSEHAANALNFVLRFPFPRDSTVSVMTVVKNIPILPKELESLDESQHQQLDQANEQLTRDADEFLQRESARLQADGWPGVALLRIGDPVDEIVSAAEELDADLIVLGSHGAGLAERFLLGSVSDQVLEHANCSVLIVRKNPEGTAEPVVEPGVNAPYRIMLAYDKSDVARQALELCAALPLGRDSEITVVNVMPLITAYRQDIRQHINTIWRQKKQLMKSELEQAVNGLSWATPNVKIELREADNVSDEILDAAEQAASDLIVFGCKDKNAIKTLLFGSITHRLAHYAKCAVLVVRQKGSRD